MTFIAYRKDLYHLSNGKAAQDALNIQQTTPCNIQSITHFLKKTKTLLKIFFAWGKKSAIKFRILGALKQQFLYFALGTGCEIVVTDLK